jgi:glutamine amidotransferase
MIALVDLGMGNLASVLRGFARVGLEVTVTSQPRDVDQAQAVVLPGVGAFGDGMASLREKGLVEPLLRHAREKDRPLLGICLGMQLLAQEGMEHGRHQGLGLLPARVELLEPRQPGYLVPNIGWYALDVPRPGILFPRARPEASYYFVHSFHMVCRQAEAVSATIAYAGQDVTAAVEQGNTCGVQFHPEKSQDAGLELLATFALHLQDGGWLDR